MVGQALLKRRSDQESLTGLNGKNLAVQQSLCAWLAAAHQNINRVRLGLDTSPGQAVVGLPLGCSQHGPQQLCFKNGREHKQAGLSSDTALNPDPSLSGAEQLALCASVLRDVVRSQKDQGAGTAEVAEAGELFL